MKRQVFQDPKTTLEDAIGELDVFTQLEASRFEVSENGRLVATKKESLLDRVVGLALCFIGPFFSEQIRKKQSENLLNIKKAILHARDIVKSHYSLIEKFQVGDDSQRRLAEHAITTIQKYNTIIQQGFANTSNSDVYNFEREQLLLDQEIMGQQIEKPHAVSLIKYHSQPNSHIVHATLKELSNTLHSGAVQKNVTALSPIHKKTLQFMIDAFQIKAIKQIEERLQKPLSEIVPLVKQTVPNIDDQTDIIHMKQMIELNAGSQILVTACFNRRGTSSNLGSMPIPIVSDFNLIFHVTHSGYPYPSQHTGWVLGDKWVDASPLRIDQTPYFNQINQRKKALALQLLNDHTFAQKIHRHFKLKRDVFDQNRHIFLSLHRQLIQALQSTKESNSFMDAFYQEAASAPSAFDYISKAQQLILDYFIDQPCETLKNEWLENPASLLRFGTPQEKIQAANLKLEQYRKQVQDQFDLTLPNHSYILEQGLKLFEAFKGIILQYHSEKMGFSPPLLTDFERKLQICAFQQLLSFLDQCENGSEILDPAQVKRDLLIASSEELRILESSQEDESSMPVMIVNELEHYFHSRYQQDNKQKAG